ncbi:hypothetical protein FGE12_06780 [Aggregicoccus sp. 17bor-14]|uniref:hypothetical protein n=1 Tax=Myxococcaceae TaxID=31 RepID=UPI00129C2A75|nr:MULTISPECIES: hypothetical protein [Myxococcaceae]MBF5042093.1 hypothetical protein [Simulacricoccus sp. 17bor-14]MRI87871.1 hypothetical protein [Aggregicoccus sp. 17bor-14]
MDPHPAELERLQRTHSLKVTPAPVVYGLIFDLYLADSAECARVHQQLTSALRTLMLPAGREGQELAAQELSPDCSAQPGTQRLDLLAYNRAIAAAQARYGAGRVRPVLVYFNNLALPLPTGLAGDLRTLRSSATQPLVWALTLQAGAGTSLPFDVSETWTYSADAALTSPLERVARAQLPFDLMQQPPLEGFPVFSASELSTAREFKVCSSAGQVTGLNFTFGPKAVKVSPASPPRVSLAAAATSSLPAPHGSLQEAAARYEIEVCHANCERTYEPPDGDAAIWNTTSGCMLKTST